MLSIKVTAKIVEFFPLGSMVNALHVSSWPLLLDSFLQKRNLRDTQLPRWSMPCFESRKHKSRVQSNFRYCEKPEEKIKIYAVFPHHKIPWQWQNVSGMSKSWNRLYSNEQWPQWHQWPQCLSQNTGFKEMSIKQHHWQQNPTPAHSLMCYKIRNMFSLGIQWLWTWVTAIRREKSVDITGLCPILGKHSLRATRKPLKLQSDFLSKLLALLSDRVFGLWKGNSLKNSWWVCLY